MSVIPPLLGYTLKTLYQPLELLARYRQLAPSPQGCLVTCRRNIRYSTVYPEQILDIYLPSTAQHGEQGSLPVVVYVHGGGFVSGDKSVSGQVCRLIADQGYLVFNVNYRLAPKYQYAQQIQDISSACAWILNSAPQLGGAAGPLYLMGDTAGANLITTFTASLSHPYLRQALKLEHKRINTSSIAGLLLVFGIFDLAKGVFNHLPFSQYWQASLLGEPNTADPELLRLASPTHFLSPHFPPVFIAAGEADPLFSQSVLLAQALKQRGHPYATAFFKRATDPDGHHLLFSLQLKPCATKILNRCLDFLRLHTQSLSNTQHAELSAVHSSCARG